MASAAHALCDGGHLAEAETLARWLVHQHPHFSGGRVILGRVLFEMERLDEAADVLRATTIQYPASVAAYRWLGEVLVRQGLWARAKAVLNQAAMLSPANRRISQLQRLAGQEGERADVQADESTTRAMDLPRLASRRVLPPPIPAQGLSKRERRNQLNDDDATPTGVAPPDTPLYARPDFAPVASEAEDGVLTVAGPPVQARTTLQWPSVQGAPRVVTPSPQMSMIHAPPPGHLDFEHTPSVTWKGIPVLDQHWKRRWHKGAGWLVALAATMLLGFAVVRWLLPRSPATDTKTLHQTLRLAQNPSTANIEDLLSEGTPASLRQVLTVHKDATSAQASDAKRLAEALLFLDYGWKPARPLPNVDTSDVAVAAHVFTLLAEGKLTAARELVEGAKPKGANQIWLPLARARVLQRLGNIDAARARLASLNEKPAAMLLAAELAIDDGRAAEALHILAPFAQSKPVHPRAEALLREANDGLHPTNETDAGSCAPALGPNLFAQCSIRAASALRRRGLHEEAERRAIAAGREAISDPRTMAAVALTLANLGQADLARPWQKALNANTEAAFRGRTWVELALLLARRPEAAESVTPTQAALSPEERLLAARAAYARGGSRALASTLAAMNVAAIKNDDDLRWWRMLTQYAPTQALNVSTKLQASRRPLGPVGTFVAGLMAAESRHLTSQWMGKALSMRGFGDRCWAAARFATAEMNLHNSPLKWPAYRQVVANHLCD